MAGWRHPAWKLLGIDPTSDTRAIRVAYAAKLKAIDPETDPQAFVMLREAFDAAQVLAQRVDLPGDDEEEAPEEDNPFAASAAPSDTRWTAEPATPQAHAEALAALLHSHDPALPWPTEEQRKAMLAHWHAIVADPRMEEIAFFADAERWLAETIARTTAFSDPLVIPAVDYFGWLGTDGSIHQTQAVTDLTYRYRVLEFLESIQQPGSPHYEAWCELTTPAGPGATRGRITVRKVHKLLHLVRIAWPDIEGCFDSGRLDLWDRRRTAPPPEAPRIVADDGFDAKRAARMSLIILAAIFALVLLGKLLERIPPAPYRSANAPMPMVPPPPSIPLENAAADTARAIQARFGAALEIATINTKNPALAAAMAALWLRESRAQSTQVDFAYKLDGLLDDWYWYGVRNAGRDLLTAYQTLTLDMARALRARDPAACGRFVQSDRRWRADLQLPPEMEARDTALMIRALLETDGTPRKGRTAMVPDSLIADAARRARVAPAVVEHWLRNRNIGAGQCAVTIAFTEATLALPGKQALAILRIL
ncbi:MAG: hypothetical protein V4574_03200 [Pseudomonadota bacterium]